MVMAVERRSAPLHFAVWVALNDPAVLRLAILGRDALDPTVGGRWIDSTEWRLAGQFLASSNVIVFDKAAA